ncbi:coatomer subunit beta'-2-like protein [Tanacetum coccineum]
MLFLTVLMRMMIQTRAKLLRIGCYFDCGEEVASRNNDVQVADFVESDFLGEKLLSILLSRRFGQRHMVRLHMGQLRQRLLSGKGSIRRPGHDWIAKAFFQIAQEIEVNVAAMSLLQLKQELDVMQTEADKAPKNQSRKAFATSRRNYVSDDAKLLLKIFKIARITKFFPSCVGAQSDRDRQSFVGMQSELVIAGTVDMFRQVYNYDTRDKVKVFEAHADSIRCVVVHPTVV